LTAAKLRPALVIFEARQDLIVAAITTTMFNLSAEWDVVIRMDNPKFNKTGLKAASVIKLTKISTIRKDLAKGELGEIDGYLRDEVNQKLSRIFKI